MTSHTGGKTDFECAEQMPTRASNDNTDNAGFAATLSRVEAPARVAASDTRSKKYKQQ